MDGRDFGDEAPDPLPPDGTVPRIDPRPFLCACGQSIGTIVTRGNWRVLLIVRERRLEYVRKTEGVCLVCGKVTWFQAEKAITQLEKESSDVSVS